MRFALLLLVVVSVPGLLLGEEAPLRLEDLDGRPVRNVWWSGNNVTRDHVISRELQIRVGEPFSASTALADRQALENLGIFAKIDIEATPVEGGVEVEYQLVEMPSYIPYLAFRFTEVNGWSVGPALSSVNLFGRDILVAGRALFGGTNTFEIDASYPWITGNHVSVDARAAYLVRDDVVRGFEETSTEITPWLGTYLGRNGRFKGALAWFRMESDKQGITLNDNNRDDFIRLGARLGYDTRDSWRVPNHGWKNEIELWRTAGAGRFWTFTTDIRRYQPLSARQTFAIGGLVTLQSGTLGVDVPVYLDYYMGGANTIRGYDVEELGRMLFGKNQLISTVEYRYALVPLRSFRIIKWSFSLGIQGAGFVDLGTAWSEQSELTGGRFRVGYGFGVRLIVPNNEMVRFDFGFSESGAHFHFGTWSKFTAQRLRIR